MEGADGTTTQFLQLEYAQGDRIFVPVEHIGRLSKYVGDDVTLARLNSEVQKQMEELAQAVEALHRTERELEERTAWALRLEEEGRRLEGQMGLVRASRWVKLGWKVGLGPDLPTTG